MMTALIATICGKKHPIEIVDYGKGDPVRVRVTDGTEPFEFGILPSDTGYVWADRIEPACPHTNVVHHFEVDGTITICSDCGAWIDDQGEVYRYSDPLETIF
jgi:hypothetical protein